MLQNEQDCFPNEHWDITSSIASRDETFREHCHETRSSNTFEERVRQLVIVVEHESVAIMFVEKSKLIAEKYQ